MRPRPRTDQITFNRRIARRRFVALASLTALAVLLFSTSVASQASSLATTVLRGADIISDGSGPALAGNHVAHVRRPASLARQHAVSQATAPEGSFPAGPATGQEPVASTPVEPAVNMALPSSPASGDSSPPPDLPSPPTKPTPPPSKPTPAPKTEPTPPPKSDPEPPPKVEPGEPVEESAPSTPTEAPIFDGSEIDDFEMIQAAPRAITEVPDPLGSGETVLKMTVDNDDVAPITPTENPRAQAISPDLIENGDEFWLQTKFLLPQDFPTAAEGWMGLMEIYGEPFHGSSPWQIDVEGNTLSWVRNGTYGYDVPWEVPLRTGVWVTVLLHERFADDGWVEMWIDGQKVTFFAGGTYNPANYPSTDRLEMKTMDSSNDGGPNAAKIMNYRAEGMFETATVYFGALKIGETRESIEG